MNTPSVGEVVDFVELLWKEDYGEKRTVSVLRPADQRYVITVKQMYNYVPLNFARLLALSEFFGTKNLNDSRYSQDGCETCDYGSSYEVTLTVEPD